MSIFRVPLFNALYVSMKNEVSLQFTQVAHFLTPIILIRRLKYYDALFEVKRRRLFVFDVVSAFSDVQYIISARLKTAVKFNKCKNHYSF